MTDGGEQNDLTDAPARLVDAARNGEVFRVSRLRPPAPLRSGEKAHPIRAQLLRELLLGRHGEIDPRGVRVQGGYVTGRLDLSYVQATVGLALIECAVEEEIVLRDAHLPWLVIRATTISTLFGQGMRVGGSVFLDRSFTALGAGNEPAVSLTGAHIGGTLSLADARLTSENGPALDADGVHVDGGLFLHDGFTPRSSSTAGAVRMDGAVIGQQFNASSARIINPVGAALHAGGIHVDGSLFLDSGFTAEGCGDRGAVRLIGAHVRGDLHLDAARLTSSTGPRLARIACASTATSPLPTGSPPSGAPRLAPSDCATPTSVASSRSWAPT
jgi:hypothetical protein